MGDKDPTSDESNISQAIHNLVTLFNQKFSEFIQARLVVSHANMMAGKGKKAAGSAAANPMPTSGGGGGGGGGSGAPAHPKSKGKHPASSAPSVWVVDDDDDDKRPATDGFDLRTLRTLLGLKPTVDREGVELHLRCLANTSTAFHGMCGTIGGIVKQELTDVSQVTPALATVMAMLKAGDAARDKVAELEKELQEVKSTAHERELRQGMLYSSLLEKWRSTRDGQKHVAQAARSHIPVPCTNAYVKPNPLALHHHVVRPVFSDSDSDSDSSGSDEEGGPKQRRVDNPPASDSDSSSGDSGQEDDPAARKVAAAKAAAARKAAAAKVAATKAAAAKAAGGGGGGGSGGGGGGGSGSAAPKAVPKGKGQGAAAKKRGADGEGAAEAAGAPARKRTAKA